MPVLICHGLIRNHPFEDVILGKVNGSHFLAVIPKKFGFLKCNRHAMVGDKVFPLLLGDLFLGFFAGFF